jgi:secreted PhoX family phosphatase
VTKNADGKWSYIKDSDLNFRLSANTPIKLSQALLGEKNALGTLANCSGGFTPWGTILTCEENYHHFYGERTDSGEVETSEDYDLKWLEVDSKPSEHYGWVVEVDPVTKSAEKLISLGRFSHECATVVLNREGYPVVYSGDDCKDECLYKFVSKNKTSLKEGTLYVANLEKGQWLSLDYNDSDILKKNFKNQTDVLINCRKAAKLLGATPLDRPEDIEQDPVTKDIFVTLTNNKPKGNYHGSILKISERNKSDLTFKHSTFRAGGTEAGFSCPDNMAFDQNGNLWITSDISGGSIGKTPYEAFGNNGLFVIPRSGAQAGQVLKVGSAPFDAEFTGPFFSPDQKTLFLSVQHPGEKTKDLSKMTSHWPSGDKSKKPLSSVIAIQGSLLDSLTKKA